MLRRWVRASTSSFMCMPVCGREKENVPVAGAREVRGVPPCMCWVACWPPTASSEPAAWRDPDAEIADREAAPGEAKKAEEVVLSMEIEVRNPVPVSAAISAAVNAEPGTVDDDGLASMSMIYFFFSSSLKPLCPLTSACHSFTLAIPSPTAAAPTPRNGIMTFLKIPFLASSAISLSTSVELVLSASTCAMVTNGGSCVLKSKTSAILVLFMPAFSGISLNMRFRMYSIYCGTSRKLRSEAKEATIPRSSISSSSPYTVDSSVGSDRLEGLALDGDDAERLRPRAEIPLRLLLVVIRDECASVVCIACMV
ncbi:hypothetical protein B5807_01613 [Epicoccum nigrum]|uniref:Uncharacterized protein n=1 Tax=Epicoccum nigrum TaxID=105696 RepID=A0A1Y2MGW6_EPING|nr:hypothetical protein B5807_01613 [Epicoccum nigrum]